MTTLSIPITDEMSRRLEEIAQRLGVSAVELARLSLDEWLSRPRDDFEQAARHVFEKNAELYRRLA